MRKWFFKTFPIQLYGSSPYNCTGMQIWPCRKKVKGRPTIIFEQAWQTLNPRYYILRFSIQLHGDDLWKLAQGFQRRSSKGVNRKTSERTTDGKWPQKSILSLWLRWAKIPISQFCIVNTCMKYQVPSIVLSSVIRPTNCVSTNEGTEFIWTTSW